MKKTGFVCSFIAVLILASVAFASWKGTGLRLGITTSGQTTSVRGVKMENGTMTLNGTLDSREGIVYYNSTAQDFYGCNSTTCFAL